MPWPAAQPIASDRLDLEPLRVDHAGEMVAVLADPALYEFTGGWPPTKRELTERFRRQSLGTSPDGSEGWLNWVLRLRETGEAVGTVQATLRDGQRAELAWVMSTRFQGAGYATEGTRAVMTWLRGVGIELFEAHIRPDHAASAAVAVKLGLQPTEEMRKGERRWLAEFA